jgi:uncharacterized membrane protein
MAEGLSESIAGLLCYSLGWITGLLFLLVDKRPFVRFHAAQSVVVFGGLHVVQYVVANVFSVGLGAALGGAGLGVLFVYAIRLLATVLWIVLMAKAAQGSRFRLPYAADLAENLTGRL